MTKPTLLQEGGDALRATHVSTELQGDDLRDAAALPQGDAAGVQLKVRGGRGQAEGEAGAHPDQEPHRALPDLQHVRLPHPHTY